MNIDALRTNRKLQRALIDRLVREDFRLFFRLAFQTVVPGERLVTNWHHSAIAHALEGVIEGRIKRLIINVPPRSLKTTLVTVALPAYVLGRDPTKKIICASYSQELSAKHANDFRAVMRSEWFQRAFPGTRISPDKDTEAETMTTQRGGRLATSVGGTLLGRGGNLFILDDPVKPEEALSDAARAKAIQWIENTMLTRLNNKAEDAIILVMQRLHEDDPAGIFLRKGGWVHLNLPAIAEQSEEIPISASSFHRREIGDVLDPIREPVDVLQRLKADMGTMAFSAQYQQNPMPLEGNLIKHDWLKYYDAPLNKEPTDHVVISWDTALKETEIADYSVATVWVVRKDNCYLVELKRGKYDFPHLLRAALQLKQLFPGASTLIEDRGSGISLLQELRHSGAHAIGIKTDQDKVTRLYTAQPMFESGSVFFPRDVEWVQDLTRELLSFPNTRHDDQVDSVSQALYWIRERALNLREFILPPPINIPRDEPNPFPFQPFSRFPD